MFDTIPHLFLKFLRRKVYPFFFRKTKFKLPVCEMDLDKSNEIIYNMLAGPEPCMIARFGATEMAVIANYIHIIRNNRNVFEYIKGLNGEWWWNERTILQLKQWSGVWPSTHEVAEAFAKLSIEDAKEIDVLGSWLLDENLLTQELVKAKKVQLFNLEPFWAERPWTRILEGKRVLIVHPFVKTISTQYRKREQIFSNKAILPNFELLTYKSVQSIGGNDDFKDWFHALAKMKDDIDKLDFDIAILGCGAYGLSLAAHIKRSGKKAIHLGGVTQILFGIKGRRWENPTIDMNRNGYYPDLFNDNWCRPSESERPKSADHVEGACYW